MTNKKILILGASGMLGHTLFYELLSNRKFDVRGTVRSLSEIKDYFPSKMIERVIEHVDAYNINSVKRVIDEFNPEIVINCIGLIKQLPVSKEPLPVITLNSLFPHQVASICKESGSRMIHVSTDCVFDGTKGSYTEDDKLSAEDLYGISKYMGEVKYEHTLTIRTSIIGHELSSNFSLIEWFLSQTGSVKGYTNAIYSGFPTVEIANIIADYIIPDKKMSGLYQVSSNPISKYELLKIVSKIYGKKIEILPYDDYYDNKSLVSDKFRKQAGYNPPEWDILIEKMYKNFKQFGYKRNL
jgi:dTDP-4-dehydrorhamnose reductase